MDQAVFSKPGVSGKTHLRILEMRVKVETSSRSVRLLPLALDPALLPGLTEAEDGCVDQVADVQMSELAAKICEAHPASNNSTHGHAVTGVSTRIDHS